MGGTTLLEQSSGAPSFLHPNLDQRGPWERTWNQEFDEAMEKVKMCPTSRKWCVDEGSFLLITEPRHSGNCQEKNESWLSGPLV